MTSFRVCFLAIFVVGSMPSTSTAGTLSVIVPLLQLRGRGCLWSSLLYSWLSLGPLPLAFPVTFSSLKAEWATYPFSFPYTWCLQWWGKDFLIQVHGAWLKRKNSQWLKWWGSQGTLQDPVGPPGSLTSSSGPSHWLPPQWGWCDCLFKWWQ